MNGTAEKALLPDKKLLALIFMRDFLAHPAHPELCLAGIT